MSFARGQGYSAASFLLGMLAIGLHMARALL
jgi:hypothetical protein